MAKKSYDLDIILDELNEREARNMQRQEAKENKVKIGEVEDYFSKISVAAIKLTGPLSVGDIIEIGNEESAIRQRVESMQIEKKNVDFAKPGDDVGILVRCRVSKGEGVYKISK